MIIRVLLQVAVQKMLYRETRGRWRRHASQNERKGKHQSDVCASKSRLRICSGAKLWSRRHFHTNGPFCVHTQKNRHKQFSQWYILTCISALYNCSQMAGVCTCVRVCLELENNPESLGSGVSAKQSLSQTFKGKLWQGKVEINKKTNKTFPS